MPTIEVEDHELRKIKAAVWEQYDYHHGRGNDGPAKEYRELHDKLDEAGE